MFYGKLLLVRILLLLICALPLVASNFFLGIDHNSFSCYCYIFGCWCNLIALDLVEPALILEVDFNGASLALSYRRTPASAASLCLDLLSVSLLA
ncbi:hypothetical protein U1Q18_025256 [Sarracenia purpurea var. burkii]